MHCQPCLNVNVRRLAVVGVFCHQHARRRRCRGCGETTYGGGYCAPCDVRITRELAAKRPSLAPVEPPADVLRAADQLRRVHDRRRAEQLRLAREQFAGALEQLRAGFDALMRAADAEIDQQHRDEQRRAA